MEVHRARVDGGERTLGLDRAEELARAALDDRHRVPRGRAQGDVARRKPGPARQVPPLAAAAQLADRHELLGTLAPALAEERGVPLRQRQLVRRGEHVRVFPLSNWTELDVWRYIAVEQLEVPSIYFAHAREVFRRDGMLYAVSPYVELIDGEQPFEAWVRYRTVGDMSCTGAVESTAGTLDTVVAEIASTRITERGETRADDRVSEAAMEDRKREGYF